MYPALGMLLGLTESVIFFSSLMCFAILLANT